MSFDARAHEEHELAREVLEAAEQAHILAGYSVEALSRLIKASRSFQRALRAGDAPDPAALLLAFGGASALLHHLQQRFDVGARALDELRFAVAPSATRREGSHAATAASGEPASQDSAHRVS